MGSVVFSDSYSVQTYGSISQSIRVSYTESYDQVSNSSTITVTGVEILSSKTVAGPVHGTLKINGTAALTLTGGYTNEASLQPGVYGTISHSAGSPVTVAHLDSGAGSMTVSLEGGSDGVFGISYGGRMFGVRTPRSEDCALTSHPRASSIASVSASVATLGKLSLSVARNSSAFYHKATFRIDGSTLATSGKFAASLSYTVPRAWFANYPRDTAKTVTVSVQTYTDASCTAAVGAPATASFTMTADAGMKPTLSSGWASLSPYNTGAVSGMTGYVKGYSKAQVTFDSSRITLNANSPGATIASYSVACQGTTDSAAPYQTPTLTSSSVSVVCTVTDSRGRSASQSFTLGVMDYAKPKLSGISVYRCDSTGAADEDGTCYSVKATVACSSLNGQNSASLSTARAAAGGSYGSAVSLTSGTRKIISGISADASYTVKITATDSLGNTAVYYAPIPTRKWAMKFRANGRGVAFGKTAELDDVFEVSSDWTVKLGSPLPVASGGTGASDAAAALANLGLANLRFASMTVAGNTTETLFVGDLKRGIVVCSGASESAKAMAIFNTSSGGAATFNLITAANASLVSFANGGNGNIRVVNGSSAGCRAFVIYVS